MHAHASDVAVRAVLTLQIGLGAKQVLDFVSRTVNKAEGIYSATEQVCLTVVWTIEKWRNYFEV